MINEPEGVTDSVCLGDEMCDHWHAERLGGFFGEQARITHGENEEHSRVFTTGEMPDGLCAAGHDVALERFIHEVMKREGCAR